MFCPNCGKEVADGSRFCQSCGAEIEASANRNPIYTNTVKAEYVKTIGMNEAINTCFKKYCCFQGRARRAEYWYWALFLFIFDAAVGLVLGLTGMSPEKISTFMGFISLGLFLPGLGVTVRRLHDIGKSGWGILINLIPLVGFIIYLVWVLKDSQPGENKYGPNPKE